MIKTLPPPAHHSTGTLEKCRDILSVSPKIDELFSQNDMMLIDSYG